MKTFKQFCRESTALDRKMADLRARFDQAIKSKDLYTASKVVKSLGEIDKRVGGGSLNVRPAD